VKFDKNLTAILLLVIIKQYSCTDMYCLSTLKNENENLKKNEDEESMTILSNKIIIRMTEMSLILLKEKDIFIQDMS
jgi:hypothetical protein